MSNLYWLNDEEWSRIEPLLPRGRRGARFARQAAAQAHGAVFTARPNLPGLESLSAPGVEMVEFFFREVDGPHAPVIFAGDTPPDD